MHFWQLIHDIKPTKCTNLFLGYLYYNITLNFAMCFGPKRTIIRESNKNNIYLLSPWSRVLLEKLTGSQLVKKFPAFYWTRRFITAFTIARHLSLSWASSIQSIPPYHTSWRSILILSSHLRLRLASGLLPSGFPTKTLYTCHVDALRTPAYHNNRTLTICCKNLSLTLLKMGKRLPETCWADLGDQ